MNYPIPFDRKQQAMNSAISSVIIKNASQRKLGDLPYATLFFRELLGHSKIRKSDLLMCVDDFSLTIPVIKEMVNDLIASNGQITSNLSRSFIVSLFPSLALAYEVRQCNRFDMMLERDNKIDKTNASDYTERLRTEESSMKTLSSDELPDWVFNNQWIHDHDAIHLLMNWFSANGGCIIEFEEYYRESKPIDIAYSL